MLVIYGNAARGNLARVEDVDFVKVIRGFA